MTRDPNRGPLARLATAQTAGQAGTWAALAAALPAGLAQPHPAVALSVITAAWGIPSIAARLAGGVIDRYGPRHTGAAAWALATLAALVPAAIHPSLPVLLAVLAVLALGGTWAVSAGEAAPTWMPGRPNLAAAGSWLALAANLTLVIGPSGATSLLTYAGDRAAWVLVAGLSGAAALLTLLVPATTPHPAAVSSQRPDRNPAAVGAVLAITAGVYLTLGVITICEPLYVRHILHAPLTLYGALLATTGIAGILTSIAADRRENIIEARWAVPLAVMAVAAGEALYLNTTIPACAFAGAAVFGAGCTVFRLAARAVIIGAVPGEKHGRALSGWESVQCIFFVVPTAATGTLVTVLGLPAVLASSSALAGTVAAASLRATRRISPVRSHTLQPATTPPLLRRDTPVLQRVSQQPSAPANDGRAVTQPPGRHPPPSTPPAFSYPAPSSTPIMATKEHTMHQPARAIPSDNATEPDDADHPPTQPAAQLSQQPTHTHPDPAMASFRDTEGTVSGT